MKCSKPLRHSRYDCIQWSAHRDPIQQASAPRTQVKLADGRGVGFYFRNITEVLVFGVRGSMRKLQPGRTQVNILSTRKREHSRKPDEVYGLIEACSPGPYLELFARFPRSGWDQWGNEDVEENSFRGVAKRKAHVDPQYRLLESPKGYNG